MTTNDRLIYVKWYSCDCEWITKHCDEYHIHGATIPESVLEQYR